MTVDRSMVGTIAPGTRVTAVAIYSTVQVDSCPMHPTLLMGTPALLHALRCRKHRAWHASYCGCHLQNSADPLQLKWISRLWTSMSAACNTLQNEVHFIHAPQGVRVRDICAQTSR